MQQRLLLAVLVGVAIAAPAPQLMDLDAIDAAPDPVLVTAPVDVAQNVPAPAPSDPLIPITTPNTKRAVDNIEKRDGNCATQPPGSGQVSTPDTATAFSGNSNYSVAFPCSILFQELTLLRLTSLYRLLHRTCQPQMATRLSSPTPMARSVPPTTWDFIL